MCCRCPVVSYMYMYTAFLIHLCQYFATSSTCLQLCFPIDTLKINGWCWAWGKNDNYIHSTEEIGDNAPCKSLWRYFLLLNHYEHKLKVPQPSGTICFFQFFIYLLIHLRICEYDLKQHQNTECLSVLLWGKLEETTAILKKTNVIFKETNEIPMMCKKTSHWKSDMKNNTASWLFREKYQIQGLKKCSHSKIGSQPVTADAIIIGQLHHKMVILRPVSNHGFAPLPIIRSGIKIFVL